MSDQSPTIPVVTKKPNVVTKTLDKWLVDNWRDCWKWLSLYGYAIVIAAPEIFQMFVDLVGQFDGTQANKIYLPASFTIFLRSIGTVGLIVRMVRQSKQKIEDAAAEIAAKAEAEVAAKKAAELKGSTKFPDAVLVGGQALLLVVAVQTAFERSGLTKEAWNELPDDDRDALISAIIDPVAQQAATP